MTKAIVIVESPTKEKTINKILGDKFKVVASMGHLIDLPKSTLGVDVDNNFEPKFIVVRSKAKQLTKLKKMVEGAKEIYVATDPDREGEAIGWNIIQHIGEGKKVYRVTFQEITKEAVKEAFAHPRQFDKKKVEAQVGRRILDRIVGYQISPLLWKKVGSRLSAGRVQSVALKLIVDRDRGIEKFVPDEYWQVTADLLKKGYPDTLQASLEKIDGKSFDLDSQDQAKRIVDELKKEKFIVNDINEKEVRRNPSPPLITSTLQQEAFNKLRFNANKTMMIAQQLYEGLELGDGETTGLITYMRTDSVNVSKTAIEKVRAFIKSQYGKEFLPDEPNKYKSKKSAQEAHEAIRPSDVNHKPQDIKKYFDEDQYKLYTVIWNRFVSSQMVPAVYEYKKIEIKAGRFQLGANGSTLKFDGFLRLEMEDKEEEKQIDLSHYQKDDELSVKEIRPTQHFTKPPPRFSDASLVKALEEDGIGRPSTYASIIQTLVLRNYVHRDRGYLSPTDLGITICDLLVQYFPRIMDEGFTAKMEANLDLVEEGELEYPNLLKEFYGTFKEQLDFAMENIEKSDHQTLSERMCPGGFPMLVKWGRRGRFLSCQKFPECKYSEPYALGIPCTEYGCVGGGELVERSGKRGNKFYGCSKYPDCTYITNKLPPQPSDDCGGERVKNLPAKTPEQKYPHCKYLKTGHPVHNK
ncbi:MAG TPA: type I DNA topoisomerase [Candidatus Omnitrophota bacterium]|nr:type I DNA topoisomerase [Candidatus Omnitrophota bacterium]